MFSGASIPSNPPVASTFAAMGEFRFVPTASRMDPAIVHPFAINLFDILPDKAMTDTEKAASPSSSSSMPPEKDLLLSTWLRS